MKIPGNAFSELVALMTQQRAAQVRLLGKLAARLDADPRPPTEVIQQFFLFTDQELEIFRRAYGGDDPITADIR